MDVFLGQIGLQPRKQRRKGFGDRRAPLCNRDIVVVTAQPLCHGLGIVQRPLGRVFGRQHHTAHIVRPNRIRRNRRHNRGVDPARQAQQDLLEPALAQVVAQGFDHHAIVLLPLIGQVRLVALDRAPTVARAHEINMAQARVHRGHLHGQLATGVQNKGRAVKHLIVLPAHHVQIN